MRIIITLIGFLTLSVVTYAQHIKGVVLNQQQQGIASVNIIIESLGQGTVTDSDGSFVLSQIPEGNHTLKVSAIGFVSQELPFTVKINGSAEVKIILKRKQEHIDAVNIFGNGQLPDLIEQPTLEPMSVQTAISTVTLQDIQRQGATTVMDALKYTAGGWTETRGRKVKQFFSVRGQKYPYPSYSVNGIWQKEFTEIPYVLSSGNVEEIKIVRSSAALIKSLSPLVGVIDITTRKSVKDEVDVSLKYGSLNTYQSEVGYSNVHNKVSYSARVGSFGTDGPDGRNGAERLWNVKGDFNWNINERLDWSFNVMYLTGRRSLVQPVEPAAAKLMNAKEEYDPIKTLMVSSKLKFRKSDQLTSELDICFAHRNSTYKNNNLANGTVSEYDEKDFELTVNQLNALKISTNNTLRFGALYNYWESPEGKRFYYGNTARVHTISGMVADQHQFGRLMVDGGFRLTGEYFDKWGGFGIEGSGGKFKNVESIQEEWQAPVWNATAGVSYLFENKDKLNWSMAAGIVTPRKGALTDSGDKPKNENRVNIDLGYEKQIGKEGKIAVTAFGVSRANAISYSGGTVDIDNGVIMELYKNSEKRNYGVELELKSPELFNAITMFTNLTYLKGEEKKGDDWEKDEEMPNWVFNAGVNYIKNRFDANVFVHHISAYENDRFVSKTYINEHGKAPLGDFMSMDMNAGYLLKQEYGLRFFGEVKNLFDKDFQTVAGYPDYGRIFSLGVNMKF
ncbi:TonB-dependent receptor [Saccharicrinis sp. GN24d3]|uniref:TonB-dependent receptor n=1 Tax=Saccharicrinis sp. GN24d3 TaxID=3458416 RepID=UPI0040366D25